MLKQITMTTIAAATLLVSMQASAYSPNNGHNSGINQEQREQAVMIQQGIRTCEITPREAQQLRATQSRIKSLEQQYRANGFSSWERQSLQNKLHAARVEINTLTKNRTTCRTESKRDNRHYDNRQQGGNNRGSNNHGSNNHHSNGGSISVRIW